MAENRSYTNRDYDTIITELDQKIKERYPNDWTDFYPGNLGTALKELMAHDFDIMSYMLDKYARESHLATLTLRESVIHWANGVGYKIYPATGASVNVDMSLTSVRSWDTVISKGTLVKTVDDLVFEVPQDITIWAGDLTVEENVISPTAILTVSLTNGSQNMVFDQVLPDQVRVGHYIKPTGSTDFYQISYIDSDRLNATISVAFADATVSSAQYQIMNKQVTLMQGETKKEYFVSTGDLNQTFQLETYPVLAGTVQVAINGFFWNETESLIQELDTSVYEVRYDENDAPSISFGNGVTGKIPPVDTEIKVICRVGVGANGNVARNSFNTTIIGISASQPVQVYVTNPYTTGSGGSDRASIDEIKKAIPAYIKTSDNAITTEDYNTLATGYTDLTYGRIVKAIATLSGNIIPLESNLVKIYTWTEDEDGVLTTPSDGLRESLKSYLDERKLVGTELLILNGLNKDVDITAAVEFDITYDADALEESMQSAVLDVFTSSDLNPGDSLKLSKLYEAIEAIEGIDNVYITTTPEMINGEITTSNFEMIRKGVLTILRKPEAPAFLTVPLTSADGSAVIHWAFIADAVDYTLEISTESSFISTTPVYVGANNTATISGLSTDAYYFRVKARNAAGFSDYKDGTNPLQVTISIP